MNRSQSLIALLCVLSACGGSDAPPDSTFVQLRDRAAALESEARALTQDAPCAQDDQCAALIFHTYVGSCEPWTSKAYLRGSGTASQAQALADEQRSTAAQAAVLSSPSDTACIAQYPSPVVTCLVARCVSG